MAEQAAGGVTPELDRMVCDCMGDYLDALAEGGVPGVLACMEDSSSARSVLAFTDDGDEECIEAATDKISAAAREGGEHSPVRYALMYLGCVQLEDGGYHDALLVSFGEKGSVCGYSAYSLVQGIGEGDGFIWSDPEPAGEEPLLI